MGRVALARGPEAVGKAGLQQGDKGPGVLAYCVRLTDSRDHPGILQSTPSLSHPVLFLLLLNSYLVTRISTRD